MAQYLNQHGLSYFWSLVKAKLPKDFDSLTAELKKKLSIEDAKNTYLTKDDAEATYVKPSNCILRNGTDLFDVLASSAPSKFKGLSNPEFNVNKLWQHYFNEGDANTQVNGLPSYCKWGQLINISPEGGNEAMMLFIQQPDGNIWIRGGNGSTQVDTQPWRQIIEADASNHILFPNGATMWVE